jgi:hypothetical protein
MECPKCDEGRMEAMGYGDMKCSSCGHVEYSESQESFDARMGIEYTDKEEPLIEYSWQSTPALWAAMREGYDGAPDSGYKIGYGKTKEEAAAALIEAEAS